MGRELILLSITAGIYLVNPVDRSHTFTEIGVCPARYLRINIYAINMWGGGAQEQLGGSRGFCSCLLPFIPQLLLPLWGLLSSEGFSDEIWINKHFSRSWTASGVESGVKNGVENRDESGVKAWVESGVRVRGQEWGRELGREQG